MVVGDAEVQSPSRKASISGFQLARLRSHFSCFRSGDNVLFEAGFDFMLQNNAPGSSGYTNDGQSQLRHAGLPVQ